MMMRNRPPSTNSIWILISINTVLLLVTFFSPDLVYLLGISPAFVRSEPWTIITNIFVHAGIWHLATNMFTLYFFGTFLIQIIGEKRFLLVYFVAGLVGSFFFIFLAPQFSIGVGASGAVFGLGGALALLVPRVKVMVFPLPVPMPLWVAVIGGFLLVSFLPGVAWQAHLGGLLAGLGLGYYFKRRMRNLVVF
jgi:membrane associated rhomboid family serine protease